MNKKLIRKIIFISFILSTPLLLLSCKSNKKDDNNEDNTEIEEEYYEYGMNRFPEGMLIPTEHYLSTGMRVNNLPAKDKQIEVYYGYNYLLNSIIYENDLSNYLTGSSLMFILSESDLSQRIKFTLYRHTLWYPKKFGFETKDEEVFSFENDLSYFFNPNLSFRHTLETNKYIDSISTDDLEYSISKDWYISYHFKLEPIDNLNISLKAYCMTYDEINEYEEKRGEPPPYSMYNFYDYPESIDSYTDVSAQIKINGNGEMFFVKPKKELVQY